MKFKLYTILMALALFSKASAQVYSCVRNISTNPLNPYNTEWPTMFPNDPGSFINTDFSWYYGTNSLEIYPQMQNWNLPASYQNTHYMRWPFALNNDDYEGSNSYLYDDIDDTDRDYYWEDGWELLWMNMGKLPNGTFVNQRPPNSWDPVNSNPDPEGLPYFVLYNRYRGTLRIFANLWMFEEQYDHINAKIVFNTPSVLNEEVSGIMRHAAGFDQALDKPTDIIELAAPRRFVPISRSQWYVIDLQLGYDPCQCQTPSKIQLVFEGITVLDVDLESREVSIEQDITKLNETQKNWLQYSAGQPGNVIYKSVNGLLSDYEKAMKIYKDDLNEYDKFLNSVKREVVGLVGKGVSGAVVSIVPTAAISDFLKNNALELWGKKYPANEDEAKKFADNLKNAGKKLLADEFDFLNTMLDVKDKPTRPQVPTATLSEGRLVGTITSVTPVPSGPLLVPGTMPTAYNGNSQDIAPANFPAYNNLPGLFALLKTPKLQVYNKPASITPILGHYDLLPEGFELLPEDYPVSTNKITLRLINGLHYALNPAVDWDTEKTNILFAFQLEYDLGLVPLDYLPLLETKLASIGGNFELTHRLTQNDGRTTAILTSTYYNVSDAKKVLFALEMLNIMMPENGGGAIPPVIVSPILSRIKLKIAADMWFLQLGHDGDQVNTFQVFTYDLFNANRHATLADAINAEGGIVESNDNWVKFQVGTLTLNSTILQSDDVVTEQIGNTLYVRAENIEVRGAVGPANGYNLVLESLNEVRVKPGGKLLNRTTATIVDFYGEGPNIITITDQEYLSNFCFSEYKASGLTGKAQLRFEEEQQLRQERVSLASLEIITFPNPASAQIAINIQNQPQQIIDVQLVLSDLTGQLILQESQTTNEAGRYLLNLPELSTGLYILQVTAGDKTAVEKVVVR